MYGIIKKIVLLMLVVSMHAIALNDSEEMEFVGAVNDGDIKIVKRYVETMNVNLEDSYFAWTPFLMSAAKNQMEVMEYLKVTLKINDKFIAHEDFTKKVAELNQ